MQMEESAMKRMMILALILVLAISVSACGTDPSATAQPSTQPTLPTVEANPEQPLPTDRPSNLIPTDVGPTGDDPADTEPESPLEKTTYVIEAGGLELKYTEKWKDRVSVSVSEDRASFACGESKLFDLVFNSEEGIVLGTVRGENNTVISYVDYPLENDDRELLEMKMDLNVILQNLEQDYDFVRDEAIWDEDSETFEIKTSVVTLHYPSRWKEKVNVDVTERGVAFAAGETKLFDLVFEECDGFRLGLYNGTPIYIVDYPVRTEEEMHMQQDVNVILQFLYEDSSFVSD